MGDFAFRVNPSTNKNEVSNDGGNTWSNFSGGLDNLELIANGNATSLNYTFTKDYSSLIVVAVGSKGTYNAYSVATVSASGNGFTLKEVKSQDTFFSMNSVWCNVVSKTFIASDVKQGNKLTISISNANLGEYMVFGAS